MPDSGSESPVVVVICITILAVLATSLCCAVYLCIRKYFCCARARPAAIYDDTPLDNATNTTTSSPKTIPSLQNAVDSTQSANSPTGPTPTGRPSAGSTAQSPPVTSGAASGNRPANLAAPPSNTRAPLPTDGSPTAQGRSRLDQLVAAPLNSPPSKQQLPGTPSSANGKQPPAPGAQVAKKAAPPPTGKTARRDEQRVQRMAPGSLTDKPAITADMIRQSRGQPKTKEVVMFKASFTD